MVAEPAPAWLVTSGGISPALEAGFVPVRPVQAQLPDAVADDPRLPAGQLAQLLHDGVLR